MGTNTKECVESNKIVEKTEKKDMEGSREETERKKETRKETEKERLYKRTTVYIQILYIYFSAN